MLQMVSESQESLSHSARVAPVNGGEHPGEGNSLNQLNPLRIVYRSFCVCFRLPGARARARGGAGEDIGPLGLGDRVGEALDDLLREELVLDHLLCVRDEGLVLKVHVRLALHLLEEHADLGNVCLVRSEGVLRENQP